MMIWRRSHVTKSKENGEDEKEEEPIVMNEVMNFAKCHSSMQRPRKHKDACARDRAATSGQTLINVFLF